MSEINRFKQMPKNLRTIIINHMRYYDGIENQTMKDYLESPISYILNFCMEEGCLNRFFPKSYSKAKRMQTQKEIIQFCFDNLE